MTYTEEELDRAARWLCEKWYPVSAKMCGSLFLNVCEIRIEDFLEDGSNPHPDIEEALRKAKE